jgi:hypothetical protein
MSLILSLCPQKLQLFLYQPLREMILEHLHARLEGEVGPRVVAPRPPSVRNQHRAVRAALELTPTHPQTEFEKNL